MRSFEGIVELMTVLQYIGSLYMDHAYMRAGIKSVRHQKLYIRSMKIVIITIRSDKVDQKIARNYRIHHQEQKR